MCNIYSSPILKDRWADGKEAVVCSGPEYVDKVMNWVEDEINNDATFPSTEGNDSILHYCFFRSLNKFCLCRRVISQEFSKDIELNFH